MRSIQVFVQFAFVGGADLAAELVGAVLDSVKNTEVAKVAAILEEAVEGERGIDFVGDGRIGALPGDVGTVGVGVIGFVIAGHRLLAGKDHAGLGGVLADVVGEDLVHAGAAVDDRAFLNGDAGEEAASHGRMDAVTEGGLVVEAVDDVDFRLDWLQRGERFAQLHVCARSGGGPMVGADAVAHEHDGETLGKGGGDRFRAAGRWGEQTRKRFEVRQGHGDADTAQEGPARDAAPRD
jgi:hypothetical protein